jgi:hypothetical protein
LWQPPGGDIDFTVRGPGAINGDTVTHVCFRWLTGSHKSLKLDWRQSPSVKLVSVDADGTRTMRAQVPWLGKKPQGLLHTALGTVPKASMRILIRARDGTLLIDERRDIGITNIAVSIVLVLALAAFGAGMLLLIKSVVPGNPLLRVIANKEGYASLSQFQMMLWTFVVAASVVYVMSLTGMLIDVPSGMLVLLGISGAATVGTQLQEASRRPVLQVQAVSTTTRRPQWSDLVMGDGEIDVARVQMLFFTLISAAFVLIKIISSYALPDIPAGIQILMGVSNGVYFGSKLAGGGIKSEAGGGLVGDPPAPTPPQ